MVIKEDEKLTNKAKLQGNEIKKKEREKKNDKKNQKWGLKRTKTEAGMIKGQTEKGFSMTSHNGLRSEVVAKITKKLRNNFYYPVKLRRSEN